MEITLPTGHKGVPNSIRKIDTGKIKYQVDHLDKFEIVLLLEVCTFDEHDNHLSRYDERFRVTAKNNSETFKRNPTTQEPVYPYEVKDGDLVRFLNGIEQPVTPILDENDEVTGYEASDWKTDESNQYIDNPEWETAIQDYQYFKLLDAQNIANTTVIAGIIQDLINRGKFD